MREVGLSKQGKHRGAGWVLAVALLLGGLGVSRGAVLRTDLVSVAADGSFGNGDSSEVQVSADGRFAVFHSTANNLVAGDTNGTRDVFLRDRLLGITERVSVSGAGVQGNSDSRNPHVSADGRFVAFASDASNLVAGDTNGTTDIFVRDRLLGTLERASVSSEGTQGNGGSTSPWMSADGRFIAFSSAASNLVAGDTGNRMDIFVRDRLLGTTERVSISGAGLGGNGNSYGPSTSPDGRFVAFIAYASNLVAGDTNNQPDAFVHDRLLGTTERVSVSSQGVQANSESYYPTLSADGRYVAFQSRATNLVTGDTNNQDDIFLRDRVLNTTTRVNVSAAGAQANGHSSDQTISADGRFVTFTSTASNLVTGDTNMQPDVYVRDRLLGTTERISEIGGLAFVNADGRFVGIISILTDPNTGSLRRFLDSLLVERQPYAENDAPVADAGPDLLLSLPHDGNPAAGTVTPELDGSGSFDPDGTLLFYSWSRSDGQPLGTTPLLAPTLGPGLHVFRLTVMDPYGRKGRDEVTVTVTPEPNQPPVANPGPGQQLAVPHDGNPATNTVVASLSGSASSDPDGDSLTFQWRNAAGTVLAMTSGLNLTLPAGKHSFRLRVTDPYGAFDEESVSVHVLPEANRAPVANAGPAQSVPVPSDGNPGTNTVAVTLDGSRSSDPDGDGLTFQWQRGDGTGLGSTANLAQTLSPGLHTFRLRVTDPYGAYDEDTVLVSVQPEGNRPPRARAGADRQVTVAHDGDPATENAAVTLNGGNSFDPDGDPLTFAWQDGDGSVVGTAASLAVTVPAGTHTFRLIVTDPHGATAEDRVSVRVVAETNRPPVARAGSDVAVAESNGETTPVTLDGSASSDPDGDPLTYAWSTLGNPLGTGSSPTVDLEPGRHRLLLTVTDPYGASATDVVYATVGVADVTTEVTVRKGPVKKGKRRRTYALVLRITNRSEGSLPATVSVVLDGLPRNVKVQNATGVTTEATGVAGSPYIDLPGALAPGRSATVLVQLQSARRPAGLPGTVRVLTGIGER